MDVFVQEGDMRLDQAPSATESGNGLDQLKLAARHQIRSRLPLPNSTMSGTEESLAEISLVAELPGARCVWECGPGK